MLCSCVVPCKCILLQIILVPRASFSFGHLVGETDILRRVALGTRMAADNILLMRNSNHALG